MLIYLDTELTRLGWNAELLSLGLVSDDGQHHLYLEASDSLEKSCSDFVVEQVLPHFGKDPAAVCEYLAFGGRIRSWLATLPGEHQIVCDSDIDALMLAWVLADTRPSEVRPPARNIGREFDPDEWELRVAAYFDAHPHHIRHHALHDAWALSFAHRHLMLGIAPESDHD